MKNKGLAVEAPKKSKEHEDWEGENFADTIMRAEEIKSDPHKMKAAHKHILKKHKATKAAITSIKGLRDHIEEKSEEHVPADEPPSDDDRE